MLQYINLLELDLQSNRLLAQLLAHHPDKVDWPSGSYFIDTQEIVLSHRIIRHANSTEKKQVYEVLADSFLDQGAFGTLFLSQLTLVPVQHQIELLVKVKHESKKRLIKIQQHEYVSLERAEREVTNLRKMGFFHCKPLSYHDTESFITMRKLPGQPLHTLIKANQLTLVERLTLSKALVLALQQQVHDVNFIHRDIKPQNILVDDNLRVSFIDYALAIDKHYDDRMDALRGSIPYVAPEGFSLHDCTTVKSDVYSLGRVFMMLWGDDYQNNPDFNPLDCIYSAKHVSFVRLFDRLAEIPEGHRELRALIQSMMHEEPGSRPGLDRLIDVLNVLDERMQPIPNPKWNRQENKTVTASSSSPLSVMCEAEHFIEKLSLYNDDFDDGYNRYYGF